MKLILSSFCFQDSKLGLNGARFYERLPPVCFSTGKEFIPDYASLFMADTFIIDEISYRRIKSDSHFKNYSDVLDALKDTQRLEIRSYQEEISSYRHRISAQVEKEVGRIHEWHAAFSELYEIWCDFNERLKVEYKWTPDELKGINVNSEDFWDFIASDEFWAFRDKLPHERQFIYDFDEIISGGMYEGLSELTIDVMKNRALYAGKYGEKEMEEVARGYLTHVFSNIALSQKVGAHLHDWADIKPLYDKSLSVNAIATQENNHSQKVSKEILNIVFPSFRPKNPKALCKILDDNRINDFRNEVEIAIRDQKVIDSEYANSVFRTVVKEKDKALGGRKVIGNVSLLASIAGLFIPSVGLVSLGSPIAEKILDKKIPKEKPWFYLMSENIEK